eukprot:g1680.t1
MADENDRVLPRRIAAALADGSGIVDLSNILTTGALQYAKDRLQGTSDAHAVNALVVVLQSIQQVLPPAKLSSRISTRLKRAIMSAYSEAVCSWYSQERAQKGAAKTAMLLIAMKDRMLRVHNGSREGALFSNRQAQQIVDSIGKTLATINSGGKEPSEALKKSIAIFASAAERASKQGARGRWSNFMSIIRSSMVALTALLFWYRLHSRRRAMMGTAVQRAIESAAEAVIRVQRRTPSMESLEMNAPVETCGICLESIDSDNASPFIQPKLGLMAVFASDGAAKLLLFLFCTAFANTRSLLARGGGVAALIIGYLAVHRATGDSKQDQ